MWSCPKCERQFKVTNQSHMCVDKTIDDIFVNASDQLVLAFDAIFNTVMTWEPISVGASVHTVIFTNRRAWLIIKPMAKSLDVKFYYDEPIDSDSFFKITEYNGKYAHHFRISDESEVTEGFIDLLRYGWNWGMEG